MSGPSFAARAILVPVVVAVTVSCGGGSPVAPSGSPTPTHTPFTQEFDNGMPCPPSNRRDVPPGSGCVSTAEGDLDGDGAKDLFLVFAHLGDGGAPQSWAVRAVLASGPTAPTRIPTGPAAGGIAEVYPRAVGAVDANGDGRDEAVVKLTGIIYHVAGQRILGVFDVAGGAVRQVTFPNGDPLIFTTGGIASFGQGARCDLDAHPPTFAVTRAQKVASGSWKLTSWTYGWEGDRLTGPEESIENVPIDTDFFDPRIIPYYGFNCGSLHGVT